MDCLPLPSDIISKIQLYVSTPEADMMRRRIAVGHTRVIAKRIRGYWTQRKLPFIKHFKPKWNLFLRSDRDGRLGKLYKRYQTVVCEGRGNEWKEEALIIVKIADKIFDTPP